MLELYDYTVFALGADDGKGGRTALCPACGRAARVDRHAPIGAKHPAHYVHRVCMDDVTLERSYERCYVEDAPRGDGLSHAEAAALVEWADAVRLCCARLDAAVGLGWYVAVDDSKDARHYLAQLRAMLAAAPQLTEANDGR
jgi:hypothetical protein